jgi:Copper binding proteins, plastocyanin/azurin family
MRYGCFIPTPCSPGTSSLTFTLGPRESRAFNNIVVSQFNTPDSAGGVELDHSGSGDQLVVTSRLYSTAPVPTVGMFIPGLRNSEAHATTVLTSIRNGGPNQGFRTNVGIYNREDSAVDVTFRIIDGGAQIGNPVTRHVAGHSGVQVSRIFDAAGQGGHVTENAVIVVSATHEVFSYAAVIDNNTTDPIFVVGAEDEPFQVTTPSGPTATQIPTVTPTPPPGAVRIVNAGLFFRDETGSGDTSNITAGTTVRWVFDSNIAHTTTSGPCPPCTGDGLWDSGYFDRGTFEYTFHTPGEFPYFCIPHATMGMTGVVNVSP